MLGPRDQRETNSPLCRHICTGSALLAGRTSSAPSASPAHAAAAATTTAATVKLGVEVSGPGKNPHPSSGGHRGHAP